MYKKNLRQGKGDYRKQQGSTLLWGMLILLTLTILGVTAARTGITDTRIIGNEMYAMMTYQTAESQLNSVRPPIDRLAPDGALAYIKLALDEADGVLELDESSGLLLVSNDLDSRVTIRYGDNMTMCTPQEGYAMRVEMMQDTGGYDCHSFIVRSDTAMPGTGARSVHELGLMHYTPAQGNGL